MPNTNNKASDEIEVIEMPEIDRKVVEVPLDAKVSVEHPVLEKHSKPIEPIIKPIQLIPNWRKQLQTYSFWFTAMGIAAGLAGFFLPFMGFLQPVLSEKAFGLAMFILSVLAGLSKFIDQKKLRTEDV